MAFTIIGDSVTRNSKYNLEQHSVRFKLNALDRHVQDPEQWLKQGLIDIYNKVTENVNPNSKVGFTFSGFDRDYHVPFKKAVHSNFEDVWAELNKMYQSNKTAVEGDTFTITATTIKAPIQGSGLNEESISSKSQQDVSSPTHEGEEVTDVSQQQKNIPGPTHEGEEVTDVSQQQQDIPGPTYEEVTDVSQQQQDISVPAQEEVAGVFQQQHNELEREECLCSTCGRKHPNTGRDCCDRCFIKSGKNTGRWIPYNSHSWESYEDFKTWQRKYDRKKVNCPDCRKEMIRTSLYRHALICPAKKNTHILPLSDVYD